MKEIVSIDTDIENRKYMNHAVPSPDSNNWGNWMSKVGLLFKEKKKKNKLGEMITSMKGKNIYIDNKHINWIFKYIRCKYEKNITKSIFEC